MDNFIGYLTLKTKIDTKDFTGQIKKARADLEELKFEEEAIRNANPYPEQENDLLKIQDEISKTTNKLANLEKQQARVDKSGLMNFKKSFEDGEKSLSRLLKKMSRYVLAVFGIRSAFMAVRNAINVISQNDAQLKADIDYMKNALAYTLEPIIRAIVNLAKQLMFYVGYIVKAWTGKNIWENANKSLKGANKEAKKLQKTLASFDEINTLNEQQDAGGGATMPSFDLTKLEGKVPDWLDWIAKNKKDILLVIEAIGVGLLAWKLGLGALMGLGFGIALIGIVKSFEALINFINDPSWEKFGELLKWIGVTIAGIGILIGGWPLILAGVAIALVGIVIKYWDKIWEFIKKIPDYILQLMGFIFEIIGGALEGIVNTFVEFRDYIINAIKNIIGGIIKMFKGDLIGGLKQAFSGVKDILLSPFKAAETMIKAVINGITGALNVMIRGLNKIKFDVPDWVPGIGGKKWGFNIPEIPKLATGGIIDIPKSGARLGNAIVGEAGAEGVLPLTDDATMTRLGQEIAKWIPINLNITNELDGRILSNRLETIRQNNSFSRNGG